MGELIYCDFFCEVFFEKDSGVYFLKYSQETLKMKDEDWKILQFKLLEIVEKLKPKIIIDDSSQKFYEYPPDIQKWTLELIISTWNRSGIKKYVQIIPAEIIGKLTSDQIFEMVKEEFSPEFEYHLVSSIEEAFNWINE